MADDLTACLRTYFGFDGFRPGQLEAIQSVLAGDNTLVVMPTGAGKSLVYQLSALQRPGLTLVVSPLIALMKDQVDSLARRGIAATYINSTLSADEQDRRLSALAAGVARLVYVAPERLRSVRLLQALSGVRVELLAVDEAHCISEWGHDFRPDYLSLAQARARMGNPVTVALTATATPQVQTDIVNLLGMPEARRIVTGFNRPNLTFEVRYAVDDAGKLRELQSLLAGLADGGAIIYTGTRREAEEVAEFAGSVGPGAVEFYHAGLDAPARAQVQESFIAGDLPVVVATNAFGMGIDRADVRMVVHYNLPGTIEAYYQEAGRAGRDGEPAQAVLLYSPRDRALQEFFIENDAPAPNELRVLHDALRPPRGRSISEGSEFWISRDDLSLSTGMPEVKIRLGLAQLEAAGVVERLGDDGMRMLLRRSAWNQAAAETATATAAARRDHRRRQLDAMIAYAETNTCRRRILLDHFGDHAPAEAPACCDNCQAARQAGPAGAAGDVAALSQEARAALIILDTVRRLKWGVGRKKLAQTLAGSHAKAMSASGYDDSVYYGRLAVFKVREVEDLINQVASLGYLKSVGGDQPVLRLTPKGEAAIKGKQAIPLHLPRYVQKQSIANKKAERQAGGTVQLTAEMLAQGLTPAQIAGQRMLSERTIYTHLAALIGQGTVALPAVVPDAVAAQVRRAIASVGGADRLAPLKLILSDSISYGEIACVAAAWQREQGVNLPEGTTSSGAQAGTNEDSVAAFLARPHPRALAGQWQEGWALGFHSGFGGADWQRSPVGDLTYRLKYGGDAGALPALVEQAAALCRQHPSLAAVDALVPVPPSAGRSLDPVTSFAEALAAALSKPVLPALVKTRQTKPQKEMRTLVQKRANVAGAFAASHDVRGKRLLLVDDLFDSGATLEEATRVLRQAGAASVCVLALTRTIHSDG